MLLLIGINAKFSHTALAVRSISAFLKSKNIENSFAEYNINDPYESILYDIILKKPDIIGFSTYIWNITLIKRLISDLKQALPELKIILGGPEAGYSETEFQNVDKIISGDGETSLYNYLTGENLIVDFCNLPFPYESLDSKKTVYYEASRGCPYRCSYCISSLEKQLRFKDLETVKKDLQFFFDNNVKKVKFIDRTFNINENAYEIFEFVISNSKNTCVQFEVKPELFSSKDLSLLKGAPDGLIQFEAGIQSLNLETLSAINRKNNIEKAFFNLKELIKADNIRIHLDLIAGLPYEDKKSFIDGFNRVYALNPHILQLGFLKLLNGTEIKKQADDYEIKWSCHPPYQVISTKFLSIFDIIELKMSEHGLDTFSNKGFFKNSLEFLFLKNLITPYEFFKLCGERLQHRPPLSFPDLFSLFYEIYTENNFVGNLEFLELLTIDFKIKNPNKPLFKILEQEKGPL